MNIYDIPINIKVQAKDEQAAEKFVFDFLKMATKEFGVEQKVVDWQYFEFPIEESSCTRCGNHD
jgi:hypothetical protein